MTNTDLRTNANVQVTASTDRRNRSVAKIEVDGDYEHTFPAESRVSKALEIMSPLQLEDRLDGGHYFFINGTLFDFRDGKYNGFIHTPDNIDSLKNTIGIRLGNEGKRPGENHQSHKARLSRVWSEKEIQVPGMDVGGAFDSRLTFQWNPFVETIRSSFDIVRLICENGMTGLTSLFNAKIPLVNRWEEHLDIADKQIQNKLHAMLAERFQQMVDERATLSDCLRLQDHALNRMNDYKNGQERSTLSNIAKVVNPNIHLNDFYKESVFKDRRLASQLPSHLSMFDVYNIATEIASHTAPSDSSSNRALDKFANEVVFDRSNKQQYAARFGGPTIAGFSDPDAAFFGNVDNIDDDNG